MADETATTEALRRAGERLEELAAAYEKAEPDWLGSALLDQIRLGLANLRAYIEDPTEDRVSWASPSVELTYPVEWDFTPGEGHPRGRWVSGIFTAEDVVDGRVPDERVLEVLYEHRQLEALSRLTYRVVEWREAETMEPGEGRAAYMLPEDLLVWLDETTGTRTTERGVEALHKNVEGTPEALEARWHLVNKLARPFSVGEFVSYTAEKTTGTLADLDATFSEEKGLPDVPPPTFTVTSDTTGETLEGSVVALVFPLVVDADARRAWFSLAVGLVFTKGDPARLHEKDLAELWEGLTKPDAGETPRSATSETYTKAARSEAGPPTPRAALLLLDRPTRMDANVSRLVGFLDGTALPRKWGRVRKWEDLVQDEVDRIREEYGEAAFEEVEGLRGPLLRRSWTHAREEVVELTKEAEAGLLEREGPRGFRRVLKNPDGREAEYLVKRWRAGSGRIEVRLTWYGQAWPLVEAAREATEARLREEKNRSAAGLFDELTEDEQRRVDADLRHLGTLRDARRVMDLLLRRFGAEGYNPVHVPASELRALLECERGEKGHARVEAALYALSRIEFAYEGVGVGRDITGRAFGYLVAESRYEGRGAGKHTEGDFYVSLSELALGCLRAFKGVDTRLRNARRVFYDFGQRLEQEDRKGLDYVRGLSTLTPYFDRAKGFTPYQARLQRWVEAELTLRKDATAKGREDHRVRKNADDAMEPRLYGRDFCPLLKPGRRYHAALGHYAKNKNAETGRKLKGRSAPRGKAGGARAGGLLEAMGYDLLPGRADAARTATVEKALQDLRAVVEEAFGGVVAGRKRGTWLTLEDAAKLPVSELLDSVSWFLFLPEDWGEIVGQAIEDYHADRFERGETDRRLRVITDRSTYEKGLEDRGVVVVDAAGKAVGLTELRHRLRAARKGRGLNQEALGRVFGVSKMTISNWENGPDYGGVAIPADLREPVLRWIETGEGLTEDELARLAPRRERGRSRG